MDELNSIKKRITYLEGEVGRMGNLIAGLRECIELAASAPINCGRCGANLQGMESCPDTDCPSGLYEEK